MALMISLTFVYEYDEKNNLYSGYCEEFPEVRLDPASSKQDLMMATYRAVNQYFGTHYGFDHIVHFRRK